MWSGGIQEKLVFAQPVKNFLPSIHPNFFFLGRLRRLTWFRIETSWANYILLLADYYLIYYSVG
jgi:hypothetical protein